MSVNVVDKSTGNLIQVAGKPIQDASNINYDNTTSGLSATKVQGAIDEVNSNFTSLEDWTDADTKTVTGNPITITDAANLNAKALSMSVDPIQDLHGYDKPWVGGAGKNKLPLVLADIKAANATGTWSGNVYTYNGVDFTVNTDANNNITEITVKI